MNYEQFNQNCSDVENYSTNLTVQVAAALWCGVPSEKVAQILRESKPLRETTEHGKSILSHPQIHCLKPRCEAIQEAIENDEIRVGRDGGKPYLFSELGPVAYSRRTISREEFKSWVKQKFPNYLPPSLFNDIERNTHKAMTMDVYLALKAERDKIKNDNEHLDKTLKAIRAKTDNLVSENEHLKRMIDDLKTPKNKNIQDSNLVIIGAMLGTMKEMKKKQGLSSQGLQESIIKNMVDYYSYVTGISESNLKKRFAEANTYIKQIVD